MIRVKRESPMAAVIQPIAFKIWLKKDNRYVVSMRRLSFFAPPSIDNTLEIW